MTKFIGIVITVAILFGSIGIFWLVIAEIANHITHIIMTIKESELPYDYVKFEVFINELNKIKDDPHLEYSEVWGSFYLYDRNNSCTKVSTHNSIITFDNKCMILYPRGWLKYRAWNYKIKREHSPKRIKGLWNNRKK